jgi:hypothetical protein
MPREIARTFPPDVDTMYREAAAGLAGGKLVCAGRCRRVALLSLDDAARYLRTGWPKCCGRTMAVETARGGVEC